MKLFFENEEIEAYYKQKGEHTLKNSDYTQDDSLFLYRLDKVTSGILIKAKNTEVYEKLKLLQSENAITKTYKASVSENRLTPFYDVALFKTVEANLETGVPFTLSTYFRPYGEGRRVVKAVKESDVPCLKHKDVTKQMYSSLIVFLSQNECKVELTKGFRHQIRSHLATLGLPIKGDVAYGGEALLENSPYEGGIALECVKVSVRGLYSVDIETMLWP